jgi:hypothetical protein
MLALEDELLGLLGPDQFDISTSQLTIRTRTWASGVPGEGTYVDSDLVLPQKYEASQAKTISGGAHEIASDGGRYREGTLTFKIVPDNGRGVGYTQEQLRPTTTSEGVEFIYVVSGALAGEYKLVEACFDDPFVSVLTLSRARFQDG